MQHWQHCASQGTGRAIQGNMRDGQNEELTEAYTEYELEFEGHAW